MLDMVLCTLHVLPHLILTRISKIGTIFFLMFQMRKLTQRTLSNFPEVTELAKR